MSYVFLHLHDDHFKSKGVVVSNRKSMPDGKEEQCNELTEELGVEKLEPLENVSKCEVVGGHVERLNQSPESGSRFIVQQVHAETPIDLARVGISRNAIHNASTFLCGQRTRSDEQYCKSPLTSTHLTEMAHPETYLWSTILL